MTETWIEVPTAGGHAVLMPNQCVHHEYVRAIAAAATIRSAHPWVGEPDAALVDIVKNTWVCIAPGWASGDVAGIIAHYGIAHHLNMVGARVLSPDRIAAYRKIVEHGRASERVWAYMGYAELPGEHTLGDLILSEGSCVVVACPTVDTDSLDEHECESPDVSPRPARGRGVEHFVHEYD